MMSDVIPKNYRDLFEKKAFANLATVMPDGSPQVTPVWVEAEGNEVLINSSKGRRKPYRYLEVRGKVTEITEKGADAHIDKLAKKYLGVDKYPYRQEGEVRVIYRIQPVGDKISSNLSVHLPALSLQFQITL
jgi:hypothetical protein